MISTLILLSGLVGAAADSSDVVLEDFKAPVHKWVEKDDPVMGGQSSGSTTLDNDLLIFNGTVAIVPSLSAPGFITSQTMDSEEWADVSKCKSLSLTLKSDTDYDGYRVSFGRAHATVCGHFFAYGYKAPAFKAPTDDFGEVVIPFTDFSDCWDDATGDIITTCTDNEKFCPDEKTLSNFQTMSFWGEGVQGDVHLEVKSIKGTDCEL